MREFLTLLCLVSWNAAAAPAAQWAMGVAMESRLEKEVNPDLANMHNLPMLYAKLRVWPWAFLVEVGQETRNTGSGALQVSYESTNVDLWGQYEFLPPGSWSPFLAAGAGAYFDRVNASFQSTQESYPGTRMMAGLGLGVSKIAWKRLLVELEGRAEAIQQSQDVNFSALLRVGVEI